MKTGDTVFVIDRLDIREGTLEGMAVAQGFYTRQGPGRIVTWDVMGSFGKTWLDRRAVHTENIFCTKENAKKELFIRRLRWPQFFSGIAT